MPPDHRPRRVGTARRKGESPAPTAAAPSRADRVARLLAADILEGRCPVGSDLPAEADLAATHAVGAGAVRTALRQLESLGLVARGRGGAARVVAGDIHARYAVAARIDGTPGSYLARTRLHVERQRQVSGDAELALLLGAPETASWLRLSGLRLAADAVFGPLSCFDLWLGLRTPPAALPEEITPETLEPLLGTAIAEVEEEVTAGVLTPAQARFLRARSGTASLCILRRFRRRGGAVVAAMRDIHPADRAGVLLRLRRDAG